MRIKQKITNLIGAAIVGSVILSIVFSTIFVMIQNREQKSDQAGSGLRTINSFTEKSRSLLLYFDVAAQSNAQNAVVIQLLVNDGFDKSYKSLEVARTDSGLGDHFDFGEIKTNLNRMRDASEQAVADSENSDLRDALAVHSSVFRKALDEMDQKALALAMENRSGNDTFKYVSISILVTAGVAFIVAIFWVRTRTVKEIVEPIVDLSEAATSSRESGERLSVVTRGPMEVRELIEGVQFLSNNLHDIVDEKTEKLMQANKELVEQAKAATAMAEESKELARKAKEANESKSSFLANMSHEIRTPMNGILGMLNLLEDMDSTVDQADLIFTAQDSAKSLLGIVNEILDFSKVEANAIEVEKTEFDIRESVYGATDLVALNAHDKGVELVAHIDSDVSRRLIGDPLRIRQVCINLLGNSLKFTKSGTVKVAVSNASTQPKSGLRLRFEISDTGMGIPPEKVDALFDAFSQVDTSTSRNFGGTGLGLNISKKLAELMGGEIGVTSVVGEGSIFWFEIELQEDASKSKIEKSHYSSGKAHRTVFFESHKDVAKSIEATLSAYLSSTVIVSDEESLMSMILEGHRSSQPYDRIYIDMRMGEQKAEALAQKIKQTCAATKPTLIALTAIGETRSAESQFTSQIVKPVKEDALLQTIFGKPSLENSESTSDKKKVEAAFDTSVRILIAEDNKVNQKVIRLMLKRAGLACQLVNDGKEAIDRLSDAEFDLVFMDCQMPILNGFEATHEIRKSAGKHSDVPIVALTANALEGAQEECLDAGMSDFMTKPIDPQSLVGILNKWAPENPDS